MKLVALKVGWRNKTKTKKKHFSKLIFREFFCKNTLLFTAECETSGTSSAHPVQSVTSCAKADAINYKPAYIFSVVSLEDCTACVGGPVNFTQKEPFVVCLRKTVTIEWIQKKKKGGVVA